MSDTIRVWTRKEIEDAAAIEPEGRVMLRVSLSPKLLLLLMEFYEKGSGINGAGGERVEMMSAYGDPLNCELRFFRR